MTTPRPLKVFVSYAHQDADSERQIQRHLATVNRRENLQVDYFSDRSLIAGEAWPQRLKHEFDSADIILALVSADYLASAWCQKEIELAFRRLKHGRVWIIPIILSPCDWLSTPLRNFQAVPTGATPIQSWRNQDEAWLSVVASIREAVDYLRRGKRMTDVVPHPSHEPLQIESVEIENFRNLKRLNLEFCKSEQFAGQWTCIAGVNGAGKSSVLQAIAVLLLGEFAFELGRERLRKMVRIEQGENRTARIKGYVRQGNSRVALELELGKLGINERSLRNQPNLDDMRALWEQIPQLLMVSYGATRNLSEYRETRYSNISRVVQRQMTLFDPLCQIAAVDVLLDGGPAYRRAAQTLKLLLEQLLAEDSLAPRLQRGDRLVFIQHGTEVEAVELPDGFRSTVAWIADLCVAWHETAPDGKTRDVDPSKIAGVVLIDEIDLHLHPSLQRALVPRLRKILPLVQFIVTTHSPLVLASFDRCELILLDPEAPDGMRTPDRQVVGFSMDEIYEFLMNTPADSAAADDVPNKAMLLESKTLDANQVRDLLNERRQLVAKLKPKSQSLKKKNAKR